LQIWSGFVANLGLNALAIVDRPSLLSSARIWLRDALASAVPSVPERVVSINLSAVTVFYALAVAAVIVPLVVTWAHLRKANALAVDCVENVPSAALLLVVSAFAVIGTISSDFVLISRTWNGFDWALRCTASTSCNEMLG